MISILIPARNEQYLQNTIDDIREHAEEEIEILVGLDGCEQPVDNAIVHREPVAIGQRAMTNKLAKMAKGEWLMKVDAHCSFSQGFDRILLEISDEKTMVAPAIMRLDAESWTPKPKPVLANSVFGTNFVQAFAEEQSKDPVVETMCLQGSAWLVHKNLYFSMNLCDESFGSWGRQAAETAIKVWTNGGRVLVSRQCYYAHLFRGVEDFPYERDMKQVEGTYDHCLKLCTKDQLHELVKKLNYPMDWDLQYFTS